MRTYFETADEGVIKSRKYVNSNFEDSGLWEYDYKEYYLNRNEDIVNVVVRSGDVVDSITVTTNQGNRWRMGNESDDGGNCQEEFQAPPGRVASGFHGGFGGDIHNFGVIWGTTTMPYQYYKGSPPSNRIMSYQTQGPVHQTTEEMDEVKTLLEDGASGQFRIESLKCWSDDHSIRGFKLKYEKNGDDHKIKGFCKGVEKNDCEKDSMKLKADEFITRFTGKGHGYVTQLRVYTSHGNEHVFGPEDAAGDDWAMAIPEGNSLTGIGFGIGSHLHFVRAYWGPTPMVHQWKSNSQVCEGSGPYGAITMEAGNRHDDTEIFDHVEEFLAGTEKGEVRIKKIKVFHGDFIFGLRIVYDVAGETHVSDRTFGAECDPTDCSKDTIKLKRGTTITKVTGSAGDIIDSLTFHLSNGDEHTYGGGGGDDFSLDPPGDCNITAFRLGYGGHLHCIAGYYALTNKFAEYNTPLYVNPSFDPFPYEL